MKLFFIVISFIVAVLFTSVCGAEGALIATLWTPEEMLPQQEYYGIIVLEDTIDSDAVFDVITDNDEAINILTDSIQIQKGKHHGIIKIETKGTGEATIFAIYKDLLLKKEIQIVESAANPTKLDLILPSNLFNVEASGSKRTGYVFLLNEFDNPVITADALDVTLTSNGDIILPKNMITIKPGFHYVKFSFNARGEGTITANAANVDPDEESVTISDPQQTELILKVAPDPIPTGSSAEIYYWLERDEKPYLTQHDVKISLSIDKSTNLSFDSSMKGAIVLTTDTSDRQSTDPDAKAIITKKNSQLAEDSKREFILEKGKHYGRATVFSSFDSSSNIQITGLASSINPQKEDETVKETATVTTSTEKSNSNLATETSVFAYPDPAYNQVEIIVSSISDNGPVLEPNDEKFTVFTNDKLELGNVSGQIAANENYGVIIANVQDIGTAKILAERDETKSDEIEIQVKEKYVKDPQLSLVPLPVIFGIEQDLFLISSTHQKIVTVSNGTNKDNLVSITSKPAFDYTVISESESVATVRGIITTLSDEDPVVYVSSNAFTATEALDVFNPKRNTIVSMHPSRVYAGEPFPIVLHTADLEENPLKIANLKISSQASIGNMGTMKYINETGTHGLIFYDANTVPVESSIEVIGSSTINELAIRGILEPEPPRVFSYELVVENGEGSGTYAEDTEVTISAPSVLQDGIFRKVLVGWENLSYKEATVTFQIDDNITTKPIYQEDYTIFYGGIGAGVVAAGIVILKKRKPKSTEENEDDILLSEVTDENKKL